MVDEEEPAGFASGDPERELARELEGDGLPEGPVRAAITNTIVQLHARYYGKGPTRARTYLVGDLLICMLHDVFTTVEQTLIELGHSEHVRETRYLFQQAMEVRFRQAVEQVTGRKVIAFMSQSHIGPDLAAEIFLLEPVSGLGGDSSTDQDRA